MHAFLLPAVAALSLAALSGGGQAQAVRITHVYFNLATEPYQHLYTQLETLLKAPSNPPYHPRDIDNRYVLGPCRSVHYVKTSNRSRNICNRPLRPVTRRNICNGCCLAPVTHKRGRLDPDLATTTPVTDEDFW
jgi:hypothetical protein